MPRPRDLNSEKVTMQATTQAMEKCCLQKYMPMITVQQITVATNKEMSRKNASKSWR